MPLLVGVSLLSLAAIAYEILLTRLFSIALWHHFAYMIISLALLGYGASGTFLVFVKHRLLPRFHASFAALAVSFGVTAIGCYALARRLPFNPLEIIWDWRQQVHLAAIYLLLAVPFFAAASAIALVLAAWPGRIGAIYRADLTGAGLGALVVVAALFVFPPEDCLRIIATVAFGAAALVLYGVGRRPAAAAILLLAAPAALAWPQTWLTPTPSPYKSLSLALTIPDARVIAERTGPLGRLTVVESPRVPLRDAPGLSLASTLAPPEQLGIFTDGEGMTAVTRLEGDVSTLRYLDQLTTALPYHLLDRPATLVLGAGGGAQVLQALYHHASRVDAVELNAQLVDLVRRNFGDFAGHIYTRPAVSMHIAEARSFVEASHARWDLIQLALLDSFASSAAGAQAPRESPIYTVEAFRTYLRHLAPGGMLAATRWLDSPPRDILKLFATAISALEANGLAGPGERLLLLHNWNTATLLVRNDPFSHDEIAMIRRFATERQFDLAWFPGIRPEDTNLYHRMAKPTLFDAAAALLGPARSAFIDDYRFDIRPATDDRPFFFQFFRWGLLPELATIRSRAGLVYLDSGYLVVALALPQAIAAAALLILLPLAWLPRAEPTTQAPARLRVAFYFLMIGLAFLFIEIAFIERFSLFLGHPLSAIAVTLAGFLVSAGLGSGASRNIAARWPRMPIVLAIAAIASLGIFHALVLPHAFGAMMGLSLPAKVVIAVGLIAPLGFAMGLPFPLGLGRVAQSEPALLPWAWGINGCASVVAAVLATLLAMHFGFTVLLVLALGLYAAAAFLLGQAD
jgi:Spermine/spermidine synthase domain